MLDEDLSLYLEPWQYGQLNAAERALLVHRFPQHSEMLRRRVVEAFAAMPINLAARQRVFETAVGAGGFEPIKPEALSGAARREVIRRRQRIVDADEAAMRGDAFSAEGAWEQAINEYATALETLPIAAATAASRESFQKRRADASVELARERAGNGEYDSARGLLDSVLAIDQDHPLARSLLKAPE